MKKFIITLLTILLVTTGCSQSKEKPSSTPSVPSGSLRVHFIDVGQADAILVQRGEDSMLVDAGNNDDGEKIIRYLSQQGIKKLSVVMGTHPHEDHIGGLDDVIKYFTVERV